MKRDVAPSQIASDNTIELPYFVVDGLGLQSGQYLYFVKTPDGFMVMNETQMDKALGEGKEIG